jgi:hypothetical protein
VSRAEITSGGGGLKMGVPFGKSASADDRKKCPQGSETITMFLLAWQQDDYKAMYELFDDASKEKCSFEEARFNFQLLEYKPYKISSVRKKGKNFEFILTYGSYRDRDEDMKKMIINGKTFKIIISPRGSPFEKSVESFF